MTEQLPAPDTGTPPWEVSIHYQRSRLYRMIYANVVFGGLTPEGNIKMGLGAEHRDLPESLTYGLDSQGLMVERGRTGTEYILREIEIDVLMTPALAQSLMDWLGQQIKAAESRNGPTSGEASGESGEGNRL